VEWLIGLACSVGIAGAAYAKRSLAGSGFLAAVMLGTVMFALGSAVWFGSLIAFFVSSSLWSKWKKHAKEEAESGYEKSGTRDAGQVFANGGLGLLLCGANWAYPHPLWWYAFLGVMAAARFPSCWRWYSACADRKKPKRPLIAKRCRAFPVYKPFVHRTRQSDLRGLPSPMFSSFPSRGCGKCVIMKKP
jgi:hypothetical protein